MSQKEIKKSEIIRKVTAHELNGSEAAKLLHVTSRQIRRLKSSYLQKGLIAFVHGNRDKPSNRRLPESEREKIKEIIAANYPDFKPGFAAEKLEKKHNIIRDPKTVRTLMIEAGLWKPRKAKNGSVHREWRERKDRFGEMIQYDGSYEDWFEDRGPKACLLASIDDATSRVYAQFKEHEGTLPTFAFWLEYIEQYGMPRSIYTDKFSTYSQNHKQAKENADALPQFARALKEVDITLILADSPQAKGRVERLFQTLQDRLIKELRLNNISTIEQANEFLKNTFLPEFNDRFGVMAKKAGNLHRTLNQTALTKLPGIFSRQYHRVVQNDFTINHKKTVTRLLPSKP